MDPMTVFEAVGALSSIAEFLGLIESDLAALKQSKLNGAMEALEHARNTPSEDSRRVYLYDAISKCNEAVSLEQDLRKMQAYLVRAVCFHALGEETNRDRSLMDLTRVEQSVKGAARQTMQRTAKHGFDNIKRRFTMLGPLERLKRPELFVPLTFIGAMASHQAVGELGEDKPLMWLEEREDVLAESQQMQLLKLRTQRFLEQR